MLKDIADRDQPKFGSTLRPSPTPLTPTVITPTTTSVETSAAVLRIRKQELDEDAYVRNMADARERLDREEAREQAARAAAYQAEIQASRERAAQAAAEVAARRAQEAARLAAEWAAEIGALLVDTTPYDPRDPQRHTRTMTNLLARWVVATERERQQ